MIDGDTPRTVVEQLRITVPAGKAAGRRGALAELRPAHWREAEPQNIPLDIRQEMAAAQAARTLGANLSPGGP